MIDRKLEPFLIAGRVLALAILLGPVGCSPAVDEVAEPTEEVEPVHLAALPFETAGSQDHAYFGDGLASEIATRLSGVRGLGVISHPSAAFFRDSPQSLPEIGRELGADYILDGTVRWSDDRGDAQRVQVSTELVRIADGRRVWSEEYDQTLNEALQLSSSISVQLVRELDVAVSSKERTRLEMRLTGDPAAHLAYLRGIEARPFGPGPERSFREALESLEQAVELDPRFAMAWARISDAHRGLYFFGYDRTEERLARSWDAVQRALELAPDLPDVRAVLGYYYYQGELDYENALVQLSRAAQELPNNSELLRYIGYIWRRQGRFEQALANLERAATLVPTDNFFNVELAFTHLLMGDHDGALEILDRSLAIDPGQKWGYLLKGTVYISRGRDGDLARAREALSGYPNQSSPYPAYSWFTQECFEGDYEAAARRVAGLATPVLVLQANIVPRSLLAGIAARLLGEEARARAEFKAAEAYLERELAVRPEDHRLHAALGLARAGLGQKEAAIAAGRHALELYPVSQDALIGPERVWDLARIYTMVGEYERALDQLTYLASIPSVHTPARMRLCPLLEPLHDNPRFIALVNPGDGPPG